MEKLVKSSTSFIELVRKAGMVYRGSSHTYIKNIVKEYKIDFSHFVITKNPPSNKIGLQEFMEKYLIKSDVFRFGKWLKYKLFEFGLKEERCEKCGLENVWQEEKLVLHLDHKDGDNTNNELENLRILCPNCHSQTETYAGAGKRKTNCLIV